MRDYVFGYGSLVIADPAAVVCELRGMRRGWGVAMDNRIDLPGYKCYLDPAGRRPAVFVCFLDIESCGEGSVNGVCLPVEPEQLAALDRRERNYDRIEVSERITGLNGARIWTYRGSAAGRGRFQAGANGGAAVIDAGYLRAVRTGFCALGGTEWARCAPSLEPGPLPVLELQRRELP